MAKKKDMVDAILEAQEKGRKYWSYPKTKKKPKRIPKNSVVVDGDRYTLKDMRDWFVQIRGFPTILRMGKHYGEGQSGGRVINELAHRVENAFVNKMGTVEYQKELRKLMDAHDKKLKKVM